MQSSWTRRRRPTTGQRRSRHALYRARLRCSDRGGQVITGWDYGCLSAVGCGHQPEGSGAVQHAVIWRQSMLSPQTRCARVWRILRVCHRACGSARHEPTRRRLNGTWIWRAICPHHSQAGAGIGNWLTRCGRSGLPNSAMATTEPEYAVHLGFRPAGVTPPATTSGGSAERAAFGHGGPVECRPPARRPRARPPPKAGKGLVPCFVSRPLDSAPGSTRTARRPAAHPTLRPDQLFEHGALPR